MTAPQADRRSVGRPAGRREAMGMNETAEGGCWFRKTTM